MIKQELIERVAAELDVTKTLAGKAVDSVLGHITSGLEEKGGVKLGGFGSFEVRTRLARKGRNPSTGAVIDIAESHTVGFKPHKALKAAVGA